VDKLYWVLALITLNLIYPATIFAGTLSSSDAQQDEYTSTYLMPQGEYDYAVSTKSFYYNDLYLYANGDGKVKDYVSNGLYHYSVQTTNGSSSSSGTFSADSQNVNINVDLYSVRFHIGQSSVDYGIYVQNTDSGESLWFTPQWNDTIVTAYLARGHYLYNIIYNGPVPTGETFYNGSAFAEGTFTVDNQSVDINEYFLLHKFIVSNPFNWYIYGFSIQRNGANILYDYINGMDTLTYYLPKGEYTYYCPTSDIIFLGNFKVENAGDITNVLLDNSGIQTIDNENTDFKIYPNPAKDIIWFDSPIDGDISISAMNGRVVLQQTLHQEKRVNISQLGKGTYIVRINDNRSYRIFVKKLVVK